MERIEADCLYIKDENIRMVYKGIRILELTLVTQKADTEKLKRLRNDLAGTIQEIKDAIVRLDDKQLKLLRTLGSL